MPSVDGRLTIITVTHNSSVVIGPMLESLPADVPLVVVDNASKDETLSIVGELRPDARILRNSIGLGYGNGMNVGLQTITTEFVLLTNPDTLLSEDAIHVLIETADTYAEAGLFGPLVLDSSGSIEVSYDVELHRRDEFGKRDSERLPEGPVCDESLSGAEIGALMQCLQEIGFFDPACFLYFEDEDMFMQMRQNQYSLIFEPRAVISHVGGGSIPATAAYHWEKFWHMSWSRLYYEKKYRGLFSAVLLSVIDIPKFALKAMGYCLILKPKKARRDAARCFGMMAYLIGKSASHSTGVREG